MRIGVCSVRMRANLSGIVYLKNKRYNEISVRVFAWDPILSMIFQMSPVPLTPCEVTSKRHMIARNAWEKRVVFDNG